MRMLIEQKLPASGALVANLRLVREKGVSQLANLNAHELAAAARLALAEEELEARVVIETLLRRAIARLGGGSYGESALMLFGLDPDGRGLTAGVRRTRAAQALGVSVTTFRKKHETPLLHDLAIQILSLCAERHARSAHTRRPRRSPTDSAMAVEWLRRFESYYRIWTPINGLGNDLTAYRAALFETGRPYDHRFGTQGADDEGYSQEEQAEGYATFALYHFAHFEWELRQFVTLSGGLWLASDAETEQALADAVYHISFHTPWNERDYSFLRTVIAETPDQELHGFIQRLASTEIGQTTHREWQEWTATCECTWADSDQDEYFPTTANQAAISASCEVHLVIAACAAYCGLVDHDWRKVADWYHLDAEIKKSLGTDRLYREQLARRLARENAIGRSSAAST